MIFIDTNYFLRFLLGNVTSQQAQAKAVFQQAAEGKISLFTSAVVIFELYWVLVSVYHKDKGQVAKTLDGLLEMSFIEFEHYRVFNKAIPVYKESSLGLVDAFNLLYAISRGSDEFKTFDFKLSKKYSSLQS
ncbi:PIN domain-containing protein [Candidatus Gottesmanbacteria bacterium]|nr:PIN domain-containing protein [Candidatus Gottesmanbacteria bacterium]